MDKVQMGILAPAPRLAQYLMLSLQFGAEPKRLLQSLTDLVDGNKTVVGFGYPLLQALRRNIEGLRPFPSHFGSGLCCRLRSRRFGFGCAAAIGVSCLSIAEHSQRRVGGIQL